MSYAKGAQRPLRDDEVFVLPHIWGGVHARTRDGVPPSAKQMELMRRNKLDDPSRLWIPKELEAFQRQRDEVRREKAVLRSSIREDQYDLIDGRDDDEWFAHQNEQRRIKMEAEREAREAAKAERKKQLAEELEMLAAERARRSKEMEMSNAEFDRYMDAQHPDKQHDWRVLIRDGLSEDRARKAAERRKAYLQTEHVQLNARREREALVERRWRAEQQRREEREAEERRQEKLMVEQRRLDGEKSQQENMRKTREEEWLARVHEKLANTKLKSRSSKSLFMALHRGNAVTHEGEGNGEDEGEGEGGGTRRRKRSGWDLLRRLIVYRDAGINDAIRMAQNRTKKEQDLEADVKTREQDLRKARDQLEEMHVVDIKANEKEAKRLAEALQEIQELREDDIDFTKELEENEQKIAKHSRKRNLIHRQIVMQEAKVKEMERALDEATSALNSFQKRRTEEDSEAKRQHSLAKNLSAIRDAARQELSRKALTS